jgi:spore germination protein
MENRNQHGVSIIQLLQVNNLDANNYLFVGQRLVIPEPVLEHIVEARETLWKIAQQSHTTIQAIAEKNNINPAKHLWVGQRLMIPKK